MSVSVSGKDKEWSDLGFDEKTKSQTFWSSVAKVMWHFLNYICLYIFFQLCIALDGLHCYWVGGSIVLGGSCGGDQPSKELEELHGASA